MNPFKSDFDNITRHYIIIKLIIFDDTTEEIVQWITN